MRPKINFKQTRATLAGDIIHRIYFFFTVKGKLRNRKSQKLLLSVKIGEGVARMFTHSSVHLFYQIAHVQANLFMDSSYIPSQGEAAKIGAKHSQNP